MSVNTRLGAVRLGQQLNRVNDLHRQSGGFDAGSDLHQAAGVTGGDDGGAAALDGVDLAGSDAGRQIGLQQRVNPGAAAAGVGLVERDQGQTGDGAQQL